jgi:hypothetical protein
MNGKTERRVSFANSHTDSIDSRHSSSLGAPSPTTQSFSPTHATYRSAQHQSSAPVIREDDEPSGESPGVEKAKTLPNRVKEVKEQLESAEAPFSNLADSPGEMTPGEEDRIANSPGGLFNPCSLSSPNSATSSEGRKPSLLTKVLDRHGKPAQSSAPSALERRPTSDVPQPSAEHHSTLDPKLLTPLTVTEKTDAIAAIARASGTGSGGGVVSGSSPSEAGREAGGEDAEAGGKPPTENGKTDEDGVNRTDQLSSNPPPSSTTSSSHRPTTTNSAKPHTSLYSSSPHPSLRGSSIFSNSSFTATQQPPPNLHLPPTPAEVEGVSPGSVEGSVLPDGLAIIDKDEGGFSWEKERAAESGATSVSDESIGAPFKVEWVRTDPLPFGKVKHLRNGWNANREVVSSSPPLFIPLASPVFVYPFRPCSPPSSLTRFPLPTFLATSRKSPETAPSSSPRSANSSSKRGTPLPRLPSHLAPLPRSSPPLLRSAPAPSSSPPLRRNNRAEHHRRRTTLDISDLVSLPMGSRPDCLAARELPLALSCSYVPPLSASPLRRLVAPIHLRRFVSSPLFSPLQLSSFLSFPFLSGLDSLSLPLAFRPPTISHSRSFSLSLSLSLSFCCCRQFAFGPYTRTSV